MPPGNSSIAAPAAHRFPTAELARWGLLTGFALWITHPFLTSRLIGSGDAWWYGNMLRDFLTQLRHGIFPVWTGQTEFAFNGAVYPLRAAPYYQYLAGLIDLLTGRRFDAFTLQHATVVVSCVLAAASSYWSLCRLAPRRRNLAAVLAALYVACPGVLGLATSMDLYMSVMAIPFLPLVTCGLALSLREGGGQAQRMIVVGLALTWYAHAPLAAWLTLITVCVQGVRLACNWRNREIWKEMLGSAVLLGGLVAGVFVSVASLRGGDSGNIIPYAIDRAKIMAALRSAFPGSLLPVQMPAVNLSDLQLGYALWAVLLVGCAVTILPGRRRFLLLVAPAVVLAAMLLPIPGVTAWLWNHVPESLATLTYYWPMHRLVPLLAALTLPLGMLAFGGTTDHGPPTSDQVKSAEDATPPLSSSLPRSLSLFHSVSPLLPFFALAALLWSAREASKLISTVEVRTATLQETAAKRRAENEPLMNHAYGLSLALPPYFSNGVMDPWFELRLLNPATGAIVNDNAGAVMSSDQAGWSDLTTLPDPNPGVWDLAPNLVLQPGRRHLLEFDFGGHAYTGTLQIEGKHFFRQYQLPASGQMRAFGSKSSLPHWLSLWTTTERPEQIRIRFIPAAGSDVLVPPVFARYRWHTVNPESLPLRIDSYAPLRLTVSLPHAGLLETFRMYFPGYRATVDGKSTAVQRSANGLVAVPLTSGLHTIAISYRPPWLLRLAWGVSVLTWLGLIACLLRGRRRVRP